MSPPSVELVVYNDGTRFLEPLQITIGEQEIDLAGLAAGESRMRVLELSYRGELVVWLNEDPPVDTIGP